MEKKNLDDEIIVDILNASVYGASDKKEFDKICITNKSLNFFSNNSLKKTILIKEIRFITIGILGHEIIIHSENDDARLES
jgi:hypothetical protein